jgi:hypothetical protein
MKLHLHARKARKWRVWVAAAGGACGVVMGMCGCAGGGTFTDPEPRCTITAETVFWDAAYLAAHFFAQ